MVLEDHLEKQATRAQLVDVLAITEAISLLKKKTITNKISGSLDNPRYNRWKVLIFFSLEVFFLLFFFHSLDVGTFHIEETWTQTIDRSTME